MKTLKNLLAGASVIAVSATATTAYAQSATSNPAGVGVAGGDPAQVGTSARQVEAPVPTASTGGLESTGVGDIIVTAQKRSESINTVPISINAATGAELASRGVSSAADLSKIVPGFSFAQTQFGPPVFTLRGIGFYDSSIGAKPSVSVYNDEVPIPFSIMTRGATLDLERVEVLKGPQGTLFGQNATGGAINYVAAKPTREFKGSIEGSYASFDGYSVGGFVSGPLGPNLAFRLAARTEQGGAWQRSLTRPGDENGNRNFTTARFLLDWTPSDAVRFEIGASGFLDRSETQVGQLVQVNPLNPALLPAVVYQQPLAGRNTRDADWTPGAPRSSDEYYQVFLRGDIDLSDAVTLTSLSSYSRFDPDFGLDVDGTRLRIYDSVTTGKITAVNQELRVAADLGDRAKIIVGGNYADERTYQRDLANISDSSSSGTFAAFGLGAPYSSVFNFSRQRFETFAGFGNIDLNVGDKIVVHGGARYTKTDIRYSGCTGDVDGNLATGISNFYNFVVRAGAGLPAAPAIPQGACVVLRTNPADPTTFLTGGQVDDNLSEDNVSWRGGVDFKPRPGMLLYASVSRGFKGGSFPNLPGSDSAQFAPVTQESVTAYEIGIKASVLDRRAQINGALFHYDYRDKQVRGRTVTNPDIFGPLERLLNVPKVRINGAELQLDLAPASNFRVTLAGTYLDTKITDSFVAFDSFGVERDYKGEPLPLTPEIQITADTQWDVPLSPDVSGFVGGGLEFHSKTNSSLGQIRLLEIKDYALVDLRAGAKFADGRYSLTFFVRNLFDEFYYNNIARVSDTTVRFAGRPRTIGASLSVGF